jgi:hypothetical protein
LPLLLLLIGAFVFWVWPQNWKEQPVKVEFDRAAPGS